MSLPIVIASNQTASPVFFERLGLTVPASSTLTLTDFAFVNEIKDDETIHAAIVADQILLDLGQGELTKGDSLKFYQVLTLEVRRPVRVLAATNVASLSGTTTIDSVALAVEDRILLTAQTSADENGIWVVKAGAWQRPTDFNTGDSAGSAIISVQEGATYADQVWQITTNTGSDIIGTDNLAAAQISGSGSGGTLQDAYDAGNTITTAGSTDIAFTLTSGDFTVDGAGDVIFGGTTPLGDFSVDTGTMSLDSTDTTNLTMTANDAGTKTLTISATNSGAGVGAIVMSSDGPTDIDAVGSLSLNSSGKAINIGNDAVAQPINIGTGAAARVVTVGNSTGATQVVVDSGTAGTDINSTGPITIDGVGASNFTTDAGNLTLSTTTSGNVNVNSVDAVSVTSGTTTDIQSTGNVTVDSSGGSIGIGTDADTGAINIGTGAAARVVTVGNTTGASSLNLNAGTGNVLVTAPTTTLTGNLVVQGTTTTIESEIVNIKDQFLYLNDGYTTTGSPRTGGFVINSNPLLPNDVVATGGFVAGVASTSNPTVAVTDSQTTIAVASNGASLPQATINVADTTGFPASGTVFITTSAGVQTVTYTGLTGTSFTGATGGTGVMSTGGLVSATANAIVTGDFVQISGSNNQTNDGLYEVLSNANGVMEIAGVGVTGTTYDFTQNDFSTDATVAGNIRKVTVAVERASTTGVPQWLYGSDSSATFEDIITGGTLTLQSAYDGGNTISTSGGNSVLISGSESLQITATGGLNLDTVFDADVSTFDVQMTGTNGFSIDGTAASNVTVTAGDLTLSTVTSGSVLVDGVDGVEVNSSGGAINIGNDAVAQPINIGTGAAARVVTVGNTTGASGTVINSGTEKVEIDGVTYYGSNAGVPTATGSGFQDGDKFYDTDLDMEMRYDATRGKWLSVEAAYFQFGRQNNVPAGVYYRGPDRQIMSATDGFIAAYNGTVVGLGYTRADTDAATYEVVAGGTATAELASAALKGKSNALDGNFAADAVLAVRNKAGSNTTSDTIGWFKVRWRSV